MKNDEFLAELRANKDDITFLNGFNKNKKETIKMITDLLNGYKSKLSELTVPKLDKVFNDDKINEIKSIINVLNEILTKIK